MKIINSYKGRKLYEGKKAGNGFYKGILDSLYNLLAYSLLEMKNPKALHFVISDPIDLGNISKYLERWRIRRVEFNQELSSVKYFGTVEVRPRNKEKHLHLCIVADSIGYDDMSNLRERLQRFSSNSKCKLQRRDRNCLPIEIDPNTGEILIDTYTNDYKRKGNTWCHRLRLEFDDAFQRLSYFCKVQTKAEPNYICSRLFKTKETTQDEQLHPTAKLSSSALLQLVQQDLLRADEFSDASELSRSSRQEF